MKDELQQLPGVGPSISADLGRVGVRTIRELARRDPERLYARLCEITGQRQDPCVLYTFRCAVYAARTPRPRPELLKWWNWKAKTLDQRRDTAATNSSATVRASGSGITSSSRSRR